MPTKYFLDKIFATDTTYQAEPDKMYIIKKIGTDDTSTVTIKIAGQDCGKITNSVAPLHKTSSNLLGPLDLQHLYLVVPPDKKLLFDGTSGKKVRVIGWILELKPGEAVPGDYMSRYNAQSKHHFTYVTGSKSLSTDEAWAADREVEVYSLTPKTTEKYIFNRFLMASLSGGSFSEGDFAARLYLDGAPLDILSTSFGKLGIDILSMPDPPADSTEELPFLLNENPIEVLGDHTFKIYFVNTSGSSKSPTSGSAWSCKIEAVAEYIFG